MAHTTLADFTDNKGKLHKYAWPGGYPIIYVTRHGEVLCPDCAQEEVDSGNTTNDDPIISGDIHYEGPPEECANCNLTVFSAYGDPDCPSDHSKLLGKECSECGGS